MSKTKLGAVLIGAGAVLGTVGAYLTGNIVFFDALKLVLIEVGAVLAVFGVRDWPIINRKK